MKSNEEESLVGSSLLQPSIMVRQYDIVSMTLVRAPDTKMTLASTFQIPAYYVTSKPSLA
jgi:hypothetical protein